MENLISSIAYGDYLDDIFVTDKLYSSKRRDYDTFLKQPLTLGMYVPCDENGNVLERPMAGMHGYDHVYNRYNKAQSKVIFEGFEWNNAGYVENKSLGISYDEEKMENCTIEDLVGHNLPLTQSVIDKFKI